MSIDTETLESAPSEGQETTADGDVYHWGTFPTTKTAHLWFKTVDHWWSLCGLELFKAPNLMGDLPQCKICVSTATRHKAKTFGYQTLPLPEPEVIIDG